MNISPGDILDLHLRRIAVLVTFLGVNALRNLNRKTDILHLKVSEGDILDQSSASASDIAI